MGLHTYGENTSLDLLLGDATYYIALCFSAPDDADDGSDLDEVSGGGYARQAIAPADWNVASAGSKTNAVAIDFPTATADWGTTPVSAWAMCTASTGGQVIGSGTISNASRVYSGSTPRFPAESITCSAD